MPANRDKKTGKWNCQFYYTDWTGKKVKKMKRGFETKKEAQDWERHFKLEKASSLLIDMGFSAVAIGNRVGHESTEITYRYAHMMPSIQDDMAEALDEEWKEGFDVGEES